jgi:integrase
MERLSNELGTKIVCHGFRRYVATTLYEQGFPLEKVQYQLGHTCQKTTLAYINSQSSKPHKMAVFTIDKLINSSQEDGLQ